MKNKKLIKLTAFMLVLCMMFSIFSANVYALTDGIGSIAEKDTGSAEVKEAVSEKDKLLEPIIVSEDVSKRTQYEKHFLCDDGSYIAATYMTPVHYSDGNGTWLEFDKSISVSKDSMISVGNKVEAVNKSVDSDKHISLHKDGYSLSWSVKASFSDSSPVQLSKNNIQSSKKQTETLIAPPKLLETKEALKSAISTKELQGISSAEINEASELSVSSAKALDIQAKEINTKIKEHNNSIIHNVSYDVSTVEYKNAFGENTTARYTLSSGTVKEDIILEAPCRFTSYSVTVSREGLEVKTNSDGQIELSDENGVVVFVIQAPIMYDSANVYSSDISVETETVDNELIITYTPNAQWLNSSERVYPVVIDPTYTSHPTTMFQTFVSSNKPEFVYNNYRFMFVGDNDPTYRNYGEGEAWFWLSELPNLANKRVTSAYFDFTIDSETINNMQINAYIPEGFYDASMTWDSRPEMAFCIAQNIGVTTVGTTRHYYVPIGTLLEQWSTNPSARNVGIYLKKASNDNLGSLILSANSPTNRPVLVYEYVTSSEMTDDPSNIPTGLYVIKNYVFDNKYLSVDYSNNVTVANTPNHIRSLWYVENLSNSTYTFTPIFDDDCRMEVHCADYTDYRPFTVYDYTSENNLESASIRFKVFMDYDGVYSIRPSNATSYSLSVYIGNNCNMYFYNWYASEYREFAKTSLTSCQLALHNSASGHHWEFIPYTPTIEVTGKPITDTAGYPFMTARDFLTINATTTREDLIWTSTSSNVAKIAGNGTSAYISTSGGSGSTWIILRDVNNFVYNAFRLNVHDPRHYAEGSAMLTLCNRRGYRLDVDLMAQTQNDTCGCACAAMIINYVLKDKTDANGNPYEQITDLEFEEYMINSQESDLENLIRISYHLSNYLTTHGTINHYNCDYIGQNVFPTILQSLVLGYPAIINIKADKKEDPFKYTVSVNYGHYILVTGMHTEENGEWYFEITDPFYQYWGKDIPKDAPLSIKESDFFKLYLRGTQWIAHES
ncbi:MAG: DNRLRE domain-containing protein [Ruminococcaceae bacterium]|nr:DNRLRE domain-containing protein [Oscillospiraceae bacterium]